MVTVQIDHERTRPVAYSRARNRNGHAVRAARLYWIVFIGGTST